jgi:hypothetical protein
MKIIVIGDDLLEQDFYKLEKLFVYRVERMYHKEHIL